MFHAGYDCCLTTATAFREPVGCASGKRYSSSVYGPSCREIARPNPRGLESRIVKKTLGAFDLSRMSGGPAFKNQITALLNQYESVRIHFNLVETSTTGAEGTAVVDVEMEENPPGDVSAPVHKRVQLRFVAQSGPKGWKFVDVQPRSFFS
jgi:hypothetical protein